MTQEDKDLLLKDLCARLPYGVKCRISDDNEFPQNKTIDEELTLSGYKAFVDTMNCSAVSPFFVKPYLRPISSMTEEEAEEYNGLLYGVCDFTQDSSSPMPVIKLTTFFYSHHLDCCGLIEKGLALEAPEDMYK